MARVTKVSTARGRLGVGAIGSGGTFSWRRTYATDI